MLGRHRLPDLREPPLGHDQQPQERDLGEGGGDQHVLRRPQQREKRDAQEAAQEEPNREAGDDPREAFFHLAHVKQPAGLPADEDEADLESDREEDEQDGGHPDASPRRTSP